MTAAALAHGLGDVGDLPVTLPMLLLASGAAVVAAAGALSARAARGQQPASGRRVVLPGPVSRAADHPATRALLRVLGATLLALVALTAAFGPGDFLLNPAPSLFFSVFWVGVLLVCSLILGPVWRLANPLRAVSAALARVAGDPDDAAVRDLPQGLGVWPAAVMLAVFVWVELAVSRQPLAVLVAVTGYALVMVGAAAVYGRDWYRHGDGFEVYSTVVGWLAPLGRGDDAQLGLASPRRRMARVEAPAGLLAVVAVLLGGHLFDSLTDTLMWQQLLFGRPRLALQTAGLAACIAVVATLAGGATRAAFLRPALVPVLVAYAIAHYFGPLLVETQHAVVALSDPFGRGANLLGVSGRPISYEAIPPVIAAVVQIGAFVGFHALAVAVAHDRAIARFDPRGARAVQFPLRALIVASVVGGVALRFAGPG